MLRKRRSRAGAVAWAGALVLEQSEADEDPDDAAKHEGGHQGHALELGGLEGMHGGAGSEREKPLPASTDTSFSKSVGCGLEPSWPRPSFGLVSAHLPTMRILKKSPAAGAEFIPTPAKAAGSGRVRAISFGLGHPSN